MEKEKNTVLFYSVNQNDLSFGRSPEQAELTSNVIKLGRTARALQYVAQLSWSSVQWLMCDPHSEISFNYCLLQQLTNLQVLKISAHYNIITFRINFLVSIRLIQVVLLFRA